MGKFYQAIEKSRNQKDKKTPLDALKLSGSPSTNLVVVKYPGSPAAEYFRFLRSQILYPAHREPPRTIMVTSAVSGDGKSFVATNLAACIARGIKEHVLLLDCDLRDPGLYTVFGIDTKREGLSSYLTNKSELPDLLYKTDIPKLTILPGGNIIANPSELLSSEKMQHLISEVRNRYPDRFVILDTTPLELAPETSVLANQVDGVLMVVQYGKTPRKLVKSAIEKIGKEKLLGVVFNGYEKPMQEYTRYGYGYGKKKR
ncbi:MAG: polysaccharide biosynthesis tyrosine autokinase [Thermodesulfobacteriota bacterium]|nr:polysaccharide biosynthesis tyrosine autokinase [Thermodesulfobacteriota bacterium]